MNPRPTNPLRRYIWLAALMLAALLPAGHAGFAQQATPAKQAASGNLDIRLPLEAKSVRFAVIGDTGTGEREQYDVARQMETYRGKVNFDCDDFPEDCDEPCCPCSTC